jgi:hypothetical protein
MATAMTTILSPSSVGDMTDAQTGKIQGDDSRMYYLDPRPYPRLSAEQMDRLFPQVALYLALQDSPRPVKIGTVTPKGEQLELFPPETSERLDVSNVLDI